MPSRAVRALQPFQPASFSVAVAGWNGLGADCTGKLGMDMVPTAVPYQRP